MVDEDSLARRQGQSKQGRRKPVNVHCGGYAHRIQANSLISKEYGAVQDQNHVQNLAAEVGYIANHHKLVGVLD